MLIQFMQKMLRFAGLTRRGRLLFLGLLGFAHPSLAADNVRFYGVLSAQPCDIAADDENISVDMRTILNHTLYQHKRTAGTLFDINLIDCKPELAKTVRVTFKGPESDELKGLMQIPSVTATGTGVAIGLELLDGRMLPFNQATRIHSLSSGLNQITLRAYVQAEPSAIAHRRIALGPFQVISTFTLSYE